MEAILVSTRHAITVLAGISILAGCGGSQTMSPPTGQPANLRRPHPLANRYSTLYSFKGGTDAALPYGGLLNVKGTLYGTTYAGGASGDGAVFSIATSGAEKVLHSFVYLGTHGELADGTIPYAGLTEVNLTLYGTTSSGGIGNAGAVFSIAASGREIVLHNFNLPGDGTQPYASLLNVNGTLYGTTTSGGVCRTGGCGTVYRVTRDGSETILHSFAGQDGDNPNAALIDVNARLYSTTQYGGARGDGTVFAMTTAGTERVLYSFKGFPDDGEYPAGSLVNVNGTFYGTTYEGGRKNEGTVFSVARSGKETVLHSFGGSGDGEYPSAGLIDVKGTFYGTTEYGGTNSCSGYPGCGTVFAITTSGSEKLLHDFDSSGDGWRPYAGLLDVSGALYGTTVAGGSNDAGTVFRISPL